MTTQPTFRAPSALADQPAASRADIIQVDTALESMRDSGFDLTAAAGEPIDNSIEAGASLIRVLTRYGDKKQSIDEIAFADNGTGIDPGIVAHVLSMGYSTRYGQRGSLGRFGVGVKLAGLSLGKRIDVYTKQVGDPAIWHSYIDLSEIASKKQTHIVAEQVAGWPAEYKDAMIGPDGQQFGSGHAGHLRQDRPPRLQAVITAPAWTRSSATCAPSSPALTGSSSTRAWSSSSTARTVTLLDPLFLMDNPRIIERYKPEDPRGTVIDEDDIQIADGQSIHVTVTIVPVEFRWEEGVGGS